MKRIVWIAVTILIMICILGFGLHTLNEIDHTNKERREKQEGEAFASQIAIIPETTTIWDKLRATESPSTGNESSQGGMNNESVPDGEQPEDQNAPVVQDEPEQDDTVMNENVIVLNP